MSHRSHLNVAHDMHSETEGIDDELTSQTQPSGSDATGEIRTSRHQRIGRKRLKKTVSKSNETAKSRHGLPSWTWLPVVLIVLWVERRFISWGALNSGADPTEAENKNVRDIGFALLNETPPYLPDVWAGVFTLVTLIATKKGAAVLSHVRYYLNISGQK